MFDQILPRAKCFPTELTDLRFLSGVYPNMNLHVLPSYQLSADLASHPTFPRVCPQVFLVAITIKRFEPANVASVLLPALRLAVYLHVAPQINSIAERLMANLASAGLFRAVYAHMGFQRRLQVEPLIANLAELRELFVVPPDMYLQIILGSQFGAAHVANVRRAVQRFVNI